VKWRCTRCGKPHAENDPPCDECGHNAFEKAIVRIDETDARSGAEGEPIPSGTVETGPDYVWACTNCGREHVRNTPPCSRCGNPDLERVEQTYEGLERDLDTPSWFEVAKPYLPLFAVIAVVIALFATGVVSPSILPGIGQPSPPEAPGNASEAGGLDLETTEELIHQRLEAEREPSESRTYDDGLAAYAEYRNRLHVLNDFANETSDGPTSDAFDHQCGDTRPQEGPAVITGVSVEDYPDEAGLADDIAAELLSRYDDGMRTGYDAEGVDVHVAPNGDIYVFYATC
jgi:predicted  nucleic acid-binding Zn-ribbon protein